VQKKQNSKINCNSNEKVNKVQQTDLEQAQTSAA
jgi:hypothetical protein